MTSGMRIGLFGVGCFICGWVVAQLGVGLSKAEAEDPAAGRALATSVGRSQLPAAIAQAKSAKNTHGLVLRVRNFDETDFTDKSKRYAIEVWRDENNGNLIYISDTGSIAVVK